MFRVPQSHIFLINLLDRTNEFHLYKEEWHKAFRQLSLLLQNFGYTD